MGRRAPKTSLVPLENGGTMTDPQRQQTDLASVFDAHVSAEFDTRDVEATMATMTSTPYLVHVPVLTGGYGWKAVHDFYASYFVGHWPRDTQITRLSRTVGEQRVVDELLISFTHDVAMPAILPGVAPTGRRVELPFVVVVGFEDGKVAYEHIYWDQASMLVQVGLLDPARLPVYAAEQVHQLRDPTRPANALIRRAEARAARP
jgi:carboxymethylenebutenolidase